jgi:hypothetical protein
MLSAPHARRDMRPPCARAGTAFAIWARYGERSAAEALQDSARAGRRSTAPIAKVEPIGESRPSAAAPSRWKRLVPAQRFDPSRPKRCGACAGGQGGSHWYRGEGIVPQRLRWNSLGTASQVRWHRGIAPAAAEGGSFWGAEGWTTRYARSQRPTDVRGGRPPIALRQR